MKVHSVDSEVKLVGLVVGIVMALACSALSGCAVPLLLGVKSIDSGDTRITFLTGADISLGYNAVDSVANTRGISPATNDAVKFSQKD